ncbi:MAG: hypothetical protein ABI867_40720, partial [Kofleriaceae bacterium]
MRHATSRALILVLAAGTSLLAAGDRADAQPDVRDHRDKKPERRPAPPPDTGPRDAPPAPRAEAHPAKAGHVWIGGRWKWQSNKWDWVSGHWERERAGKAWREGKWEKKGDYWVFVDGGWIAGGPATPPLPPPPAVAEYPNAAPPAPRDEHHPARTGQVWVNGRWTWKLGKWEWAAGRWENARAGKKFRDGRWEKKGDRWAFTDGDWIDDASPVAEYPTSAPPAPRPEAHPARVGQVWVNGKWTWKLGKWEWAAGRWENVRVGKKFRDGRWEKKGDRWSFTDGDWIDDAAPPPVDYPRNAPPAPRRETQPTRQGFVWLPGRWDWKNGKWEWLNGRYETVRVGKKFREGRWDKQGDRYTFVEGDWIDDVVVTDYPRDAPPARRDERAAARAGFLWVAGEWQWKANKWEWVSGHYERPRAGKRWREGRWEKRDDRYAFVAGDWI